jgi:hypothetical protein
LILLETAERLLGMAQDLGLEAWLEPKTASIYLYVRPCPDAAWEIIRISDHATVSHRHPPVAINVAPHRDGIVEAEAFIFKLRDG